MFLFRSWYHGPISREEAESRLKGQRPGSYLVRSSESRTGFSLSALYVESLFAARLVALYALGLRKASCVRKDDLLLWRLV